MKRKFIAIALTALTLTACTEKEPPEETDAIPQEFSSSTTETAVSEPVTETSEESEMPGTVITVFGQEYSPLEDYITIDMSRSGEKTDVNALALFDDLRHIAIENAGDKSIDFLDGLTLDTLSVCGSSRPAADLIPALEKCSFTSLYYQPPEDNTRFIEDCTALFTAFPGCEVRVAEANSWGTARPSPLAFYCTREIYGEDTLALHITNNDRADCDWVINSVWIEGAEGNELSPDSTGVLTDGRQSVGETVAYNYTLDYELNVNMTDKGIYDLCFEAFSSDTYEVDAGPRTFRCSFFVCSPFDEPIPSETKEYSSYIRHKTPDFLSPDQLAAFEAAYRTYEDYFHMDSEMTEEYAQSHTAEEFLDIASAGLTREFAYKKSLGIYIGDDGNLQAISASSGGDLMAGGAEFFPINDSTFAAVTAMGHEDDPYHTWYEAVNFHMTEGDDGWRFDVFQTWF